jgi:glycosyltransferase involved in cell wall biosynthesis
MKLPLTVIVITKNEEENIEGCLKQISLWVQEIIIVDSNSTDNTVNIAKRFTKNIHIRRFSNFKEKRQFGLSKATSEWVLFLDADERINDGLTNEIKEKVLHKNDTNTNNPEIVGYYIPFKHFFMGQWLRYGGWYPSYLPRLAKRKNCDIKNTIHELLVINGKTAKLQNPMLHYGDISLVQRVAKTNLYTSLQARERYKKNKGNIYTLSIMMCLMPIRRFFISYFLKRGFLDRMPGFIRALLLAGTSFMIYAKQVEMIMTVKKGNSDNRENKTEEGMGV